VREILNSSDDDSREESDASDKIRDLEERITREIKLYLWQFQRLFDDDIKDVPCTICMVKFELGGGTLTYLPCNKSHVFHMKCLEEWL
jgi:hypothetical protein